jgi:hypothetical protein
VSELYVYGITRPGRLPARVAERGVELVSARGRAAIVSAVDASPVEATRRNLLAHADVVESLHERAVVLPARFGTVLPDRRGVVELLSLPEVGALLERHAASSELTVKGDYDEAVLAQVAPGAAAQRAAYRLNPSFDNALALGEAVADVLADRRARDAGRILDALEPLALDLRVGEPAGEFAVVSLALLVDRGRVDEVSAALDALAAELSPPLRFRLTGPLPPYSFVDLDLGVPA